MLNWDDYEDDNKSEEGEIDPITGGKKAPADVPKACNLDQPDCEACE